MHSHDLAPTASRTIVCLIHHKLSLLISMCSTHKYTATPARVTHTLAKGCQSPTNSHFVLPVLCCSYQIYMYLQFLQLSSSVALLFACLPEKAVVMGSLQHINSCRPCTCTHTSSTGKHVLWDPYALPGNLIACTCIYMYNILLYQYLHKQPPQTKIFGIAFLI